MKNICIFLIIGMSIFSTRNTFSQSSCFQEKSFQIGDIVYLWSTKDWNSGPKTWVKYIYDGKKDGKYELAKANSEIRSIFMLNSLENVFSENEYEKLQHQNPSCNAVTAEHKIKFNNESLSIINNYRAQYGTKALQSDPVLDKAAQDYVDWMVKNLNSYAQLSHSADGNSVSQRVVNAAKSLNATVLTDSRGTEYAFSGSGENLSGGSICAEDAFETWRKSPGHNRNMKNTDYQYIGFGIACGVNNNGDKIVFAAQVFGIKKAENENTSVNEDNNTNRDTNNNNFLNSNQSLVAGKKLYSKNKGYYLTLQDDGNLCIYQSQDNSFEWCSMAYGFSGGVLKLQSDGNLVVYNQNNEAKWASRTHPFFNDKFKIPSNKPVKLVLENNGRLNLYSANREIVWSNK
ncbi:CAP domain-containing protein [Polaribacter sp.]|uniref:CAP domain-containing protein n=1 Tax=Polaribacter sp. TaxID=1920175 RepID=UPI003EF3FC4F